MLGRTKRKVRYYLQDGPTIEGTEAGRTRTDYIVWLPKVITGEDTEPEVAGTGHFEIERQRVLFRQVIG